MRLKRILKWTVLGLISLVIVAGILLFTVDLGFLRGVVEKRVSLATGRSFAIHGDLSIRFGRELLVRAEDVHMGNPAWAGPGDFIAVDTLGAVVDTRSLWRGPLTIKNVEITGADVVLQQNPAGQANWKLETVAPAADEGEPELLLVESLRLLDAVIDLESARLDRPVNARIELLEHQLDTNGLVRATLDGTLSGRAVRFEASGGPYASLWTGQNIHVEGAGSMGSIALTGQADFDNLWVPLRPEIDLHMSGPEFEELTEMLGIERLGSGDLALQVSTGEIEGGLGVTLAGNLGPLNIDVNASMPSAREFDRAAVAARMDGPNLGRVARLAGIDGWPEEPFFLDAVVHRPDDALEVERLELTLGDNRINAIGSLPSYPAYTDGRFSLEASGQDFDLIARLVGQEGWPGEPFEIRSGLAMAGDELVIEEFDLLLAGARITVDGRMPGFPGLAGADLTLAVHGPELAPFQELFGLQSPLTGPFDISGKVRVIENRTVLDLQYETTLGGGSITGTVGSGEGLAGTALVASIEGPDAAALGALFGLPGLAETPWSSRSEFSIADPAFFEVSRMEFDTAGLAIELSGQIGAEALYQDTDLRFSVRGDRLADFQALVGDGYALPGQAFEISGRATARAEAWALEGVSGNVGSSRFRLNGNLGRGPGLAGTSIALEAEGDDFGRVLELPGHARLPDGPFDGSLSLALAQGRLRLDELDVAAGPFRLRLDADVPWPFSPAGSRFNVELSGIDITRILPEAAGFDLAVEDYEVHFTGELQEDRVEIRRGSIRIGESSIIAQGSLDLPPNLSATDLVFEINSPDLSRLGTIDGRRWASVPFKLHSTFTGTQSRFRMSRFLANLGGNDFEGAFFVDFEEAIPSFDLQLRTKLLDLRPFLGEPREAGETERTAPENGARLIPDIAFPMELLAKANGQFTIVAGEVKLRKSTLFNSALIGRVKDGALDITEAGIDGYGGRLVGTLSLAPGVGGGADARLTARSKGLVLDFVGAPDTEREKMPAFDIDLDLRGAGHTIREAAATLNGKIIANSPGGQLKNVKDGGLEGLFLARVVTAISPSAARLEEVNISCFATAADVANGVLLLDPGMALQSDRLNLFASGKINLGTEKLDVNFRAQTRKAVDISAGELFSPYLKLSGTLGDPSMALDTKGTLLSGGAAYLSGGLSILAKKALDQLGGTKDPCADYLRKVESEEP